MISTPPRMVIQQSMERISSFYHASATAPRTNHSDFFNTHACLQQSKDISFRADRNATFSVTVACHTVVSAAGSPCMGGRIVGDEYFEEPNHQVSIEPGLTTAETD